MRVLVTGGCGFIGANFLCRFVPRLPQVPFLNLDALTYAANPLSLAQIQNLPNYHFAHIHLANAEALHQTVHDFQPTHIVHFAAETHVDRSLKSPRDFLDANVIGTFNLLEAARSLWEKNPDNPQPENNPHPEPQTSPRVFHHVSTDEVFGELGETGAFTESTPYNPSSPYSATKAASDHLVRAYHRSFNLPVKITNCSNNYGPFQFPEKLIPLMTLNAANGKPLPVYGSGANIRDWLFVQDHCDAIYTVLTQGKIGETYNIGGNAERTNLQVVQAIIAAVAETTGKPHQEVESLLTFVPDRPGHDFRYAIDTTKITTELGWKPQVTFEEGLAMTVRWYLQNPDWVAKTQSGEHLRWIETQYNH